MCQRQIEMPSIVMTLKGRYMMEKRGSFLFVGYTKKQGAIPATPHERAAGDFAPEDASIRRFLSECDMNCPCNARIWWRILANAKQPTALSAGLIFPVKGRREVSLRAKGFVPE